MGKWRGNILGRMEASIEIKALPEKVWELLAFDRFPEWEEGNRKNVKNVSYTSEVRTPDDKFRVGAIAHIIAKNEEFDIEILESVKHEKISARSNPRGVENLILTFTLMPTELGTYITYVIDYVVSFGSLGKLLDKLMRKSGERELETSLGNLKSILEK